MSPPLASTPRAPLSRTTAAGLIAGLAILGEALAQDGPWSLVRGLQVVVACAVAALGVWARDHAPAPPPSVLEVARRVSARELTPEEGARLLHPDDR